MAGLSRRVLILLGLIFMLAVQGAYSFVTTPEPYPTIRMPSFGSATSADGSFVADQVKIHVAFADGSDVAVKPAELMDAFSYSSSGPALLHVFGPDAPQVSPEVTSWLKYQVADLNPSSSPASVTFCFQDADVDVDTGDLINVGPCQTRKVEFS